MSSDTLTITDNRTGRVYEIPITDGTIRAMDLRQIKARPDEFGLMTYDPALQNTASCRSAITYIDGDKGILRYRGYPIEELAEKSTFLEVAYLILSGELPTRSQLDDWVKGVTWHSLIHENTKKVLDGFRWDAHPMGILISLVSHLSTIYPEAKNIADPETRDHQILRLVGKMPTLAAFAYRHSKGLPYVYPDHELSYAGNFLNMMFRRTEAKYVPDPICERSLDVLFMLHADHEQNCSTNAMRAVGSSHVDPYSAVAAAISALYGPLHGGANEAVLKMLREIGSVEKVPGYIKGVKAGERKLMGFGHRIYKNFDPRGKIIRELAEHAFERGGKNPLLEIARELARIALEDDYFVHRKLYPNVDFYSGILYEGLRVPTDMFTVMFAIPRTIGWLAQWRELIQDTEQKIARPRQIYTGYDERPYVPLEERGAAPQKKP